MMLGQRKRWWCIVEPMSVIFSVYIWHVMFNQSHWQSGDRSTSERQTFEQCQYNVGPPSAMLAQHWFNVSCKGDLVARVGAIPGGGERGGGCCCPSPGVNITPLITHHNSPGDQSHALNTLRHRHFFSLARAWARILVQVTIYCRLQIGRDGHLDQSETYHNIVTCTILRVHIFSTVVQKIQNWHFFSVSSCSIWRKILRQFGIKIK